MNINDKWYLYIRKCDVCNLSEWDIANIDPINNFMYIETGAPVVAQHRLLNRGIPSVYRMRDGSLKVGLFTATGLGVFQSKSPTTLIDQVFNEIKEENIALYKLRNIVR